MADQSPLPANFVAALRAVLPADRLLTDPAECWTYGYDNSRRHHPPQLVALPTSHDEVAALVRCCNQQGIPIVARGRGTGTCGAAVPIAGGVVLSLERMNRVLRLDAANRPRKPTLSCCGQRLVEPRPFLRGWRLRPRPS